jgi:hypothetical protein
MGLRMATKGKVVGVGGKRKRALSLVLLCELESHLLTPLAGAKLPPGLLVYQVCS